MTMTAEPPAPGLEQFRDLPAREVEDMACAAHLGVWTARRRGMHMSRVHWEWAELAMNTRRLALVAPREHGKSEALSVNATAWRCIYHPGTWSYLFAQTADQAEALLSRIKSVLEELRPDLVENATTDKATRLVLANGCRIDCAGAGKRVRGAHPDFIIGDDVLDDESTATATQRRKIHRWWFGSIVPMAHPGTTRRVRHPDGTSTVHHMPPTRAHLVGTPFHDSDLLMSMKQNPQWVYHRYAAEFAPEQLVEGTLAVEVAA